MRYLFIFIFLASNSYSIGQDPVLGLNLQFRPIMNSEELMIAETSSSEQESIEFFKCYLSAFALLKNDEVVWKEKESFKLLDASVPSSMSLNLNIPEELNYDQLRFMIGIDSITSVSGAMGGDLDPTRGMYWAWNSGYIHFKLEGKSIESSANDNSFEFHLGGYSRPLETYRWVYLDMDHGKIKVIQIDLSEFLSLIDLRETHHVMSEGEKAHEIAGTLPGIFSLKK